MATSTSVDDYMPTFYVGHHDNHRVLPITSRTLRKAQDAGYDMLTTPVTNSHFHQRVLALLSLCSSDLQSDGYAHQGPVPTVHPLTLLDTPLTPGDIITQLIAIASPWIDLCSPDPLVYELSRQVLAMEIAYAAFCGIGNVVVQGPRLHHGKLHNDGGLTQYARAVQEALSIGNYVQILIKLPIVDGPAEYIDKQLESLVPSDRKKSARKTEGEVKRFDVFGSWDAWNMVRSVCKYSNRLFVALTIGSESSPMAVESRWHSEPIRLLAMNAETFRGDDEGYPLLHKAHRNMITRYMRIKNPPWLLLCNIGPIPGLQTSSCVTSNVTTENFSSPTPAEAAHQPPQNKSGSEDSTKYLDYVRFLQTKQPKRDAAEDYLSGWQEYLQSPLQPLADNLESMTYEVFEKDPVKYERYEKAIERALRDWIKFDKPRSSPEGRVVIAVAGAGRGPLVTRALLASATTGVAIELWAIEKNPNAFVLLQRHNAEDWNNRVNVVQSDMRSWKGPWRDLSVPYEQATHGAADPHQASGTDPRQTQLPHTPSPPSIIKSTATQPTHTPVDILISELLGSFADNEVSPECLDGVLHLLAPHGISIPSSYSTYLTPVAAPKLHADLLSRSAHDTTAAEIPYVCMLHAIDYLAPDPAIPSPSNSLDEKVEKQLYISPQVSIPKVLPVWRFEHGPRKDIPVSNDHNKRHAHLTFRTQDRGVCHGLAGYFEAVLYAGEKDDGSEANVELSTNPLTMNAKSPGMISWFPIYFPLKTPLYLPDHSALDVSMWRQTDGRKVWYEWMVESFGYYLVLGQEQHSRVRLGYSDLHSSLRAGCMM